MEIFLTALLAFSIATLFGPRFLAFVVITPVALWLLLCLYVVMASLYPHSFPLPR